MMSGKDSTQQPKRWLDVEALVRLSDPGAKHHAPVNEALWGILRQDPKLHRLGEALDMSHRAAHGN